MQQFIYDLIIHFAPAFLIGLLHTAIPCEDKAIFFFWSFGISKNSKKSVLLLFLYGLGLMFSNLLIMIIVSAISLTPQLVVSGFEFDPYILSFLGALTSTIAAVILFFLITRSNYAQKIHSKYKDAIINLNWEKYRTPFLFGFLVGFAPCIFEHFIYSQGIILTTTKGFLMGPLYVFYFCCGTFLGLILIALIKHGTSRFIKPNEERNNTIFTVKAY